MTTNLKIKSEINIENTDVVQTTKNLTDIIAEYKAIAIKLSLLADAVPETPISQKELIDKEIGLLDEQAGLLEMALSRPVKSLDDARALMTLWHHEIVLSQSNDSLSTADELVSSVFDYLKVA